MGVAPNSFFLLMELIEVKLDRRVILTRIWLELHKVEIMNGYTWNDYCNDMRLYQYKDKCRYCGK